MALGWRGDASNGSAKVNIAGDTVTTDRIAVAILTGAHARLRLSFSALRFQKPVLSTFAGNSSNDRKALVTLSGP
jgi:hypothetical protein